MIRILVTAITVAILAIAAQGAVITFGTTDIPGIPTPYTEQGFTFTPTNTLGTIAPYFFFPGSDAANGYFLGFAATNPITLTGPGNFDLNSALIGRYKFGSGIADVTITGYKADGGTVSVTFNGLTTATPETIGLKDLTMAVFTNVGDAGIDNVDVSVGAAATPEPGSLALVAAGASLTLCRFRRKR